MTTRDSSSPTEQSSDSLDSSQSSENEQELFETLCLEYQWSKIVGETLGQRNDLVDIASDALEDRLRHWTESELPWKRVDDFAATYKKPSQKTLAALRSIQNYSNAAPFCLQGLENENADTSRNVPPPVHDASAKSSASCSKDIRGQSSGVLTSSQEINWELDEVLNVICSGLSLGKHVLISGMGYKGEVLSRVASKYERRRSVLVCQPQDSSTPVKAFAKELKALLTEINPRFGRVGRNCAYSDHSDSDAASDEVLSGSCASSSGRGRREAKSSRGRKISRTPGGKPLIVIHGADSIEADPLMINHILPNLKWIQVIATLDDLRWRIQVENIWGIHRYRRLLIFTSLHTYKPFPFLVAPLLPAIQALDRYRSCKSSGPDDAMSEEAQSKSSSSGSAVTDEEEGVDDSEPSSVQVPIVNVSGPDDSADEDGGDTHSAKRVISAVSGEEPRRSQRILSKAMRSRGGIQRSRAPVPHRAKRRTVESEESMSSEDSSMQENSENAIRMIELIRSLDGRMRSDLVATLKFYQKLGRQGEKNRNMTILQNTRLKSEYHESAVRLAQEQLLSKNKMNLYLSKNDLDKVIRLVSGRGQQ